MSERRQLLNIAYRLLGSLADAEDVVQEAYARWYTLAPADRDAIVSPGAWLTTVTSRICLDLLGSARVRRERYVGTWLPEPLAGGTDADPADRVTLDESVHMAFLVVLENMTPAERVAFVLHDVFRYSFAEIARIVGRTPGACRQLASSARRRVANARVRHGTDDSVPLVADDRAHGTDGRAQRSAGARARHGADGGVQEGADDRARHGADDRARHGAEARARRGAGQEMRRGTGRGVRGAADGRQAEIVRAFARAWAARDIDALVGLLDPAAIAVSDGGGVVEAALEPIVGGDNIAHGLVEIMRLVPDLVVLERSVNGQPGVVAQLHGVTSTVIAFEVAGERITRFWAVRNPEKLQAWSNMLY